jgi:putative ATP-dependent endonuclease of the OLD family
MKISEVRVQGYRCIEDLSISFDDLTALIGTGGVGKSAFLRALEWFFDDTALDEEDLFLSYGDDPTRTEELIVTVSFDSLGPSDKEVLGRYGGGDTTTFTRIGRPTEKSKLSGTALRCPDFDAIRAETDGRKRRGLFATFVEERGEDFGFQSPAPTKVADADLMMEEFERANPLRCEVDNEDASHLFGWGGGPKLRDRFDYVLVGATLEAADAMGGGQGSALSRLLSDVGELDEQTEREVDELQKEAEAGMEALISAARAPDLLRIGESITERMQSHAPGARVELGDEISSLGRPKPRVVAKLREGDGHPTEVARQGHGLQRALVIAVLHALADTTAGIHLQDGEVTEPRALMLAVEEPELYQHPFQARALAESLRALANVPSEEKPRSLQVAYSSHSPHFVRPALFENLRILGRTPDLATSQVSGDSSKVAEILVSAGLPGDLGGKVRQTLAKSLEEAVFARAVLLCEGPTDAALIAAVAGREGGFDGHGIAVADCHGKSIIPLAYAILCQLKIPTYVLFDADVGLEQRLAAKAKMPDGERQLKLKETAEKNAALLRLCGDSEEDWPERAVRTSSANFADRLEDDLKEIWPEFAHVREEVGAELGIGPKSDETYRQAATIAENPPKFLLDIVEKVKGLPT